MDASVLAVAIADDGDQGGRARSRIREDADLYAPHLVDIEVLSVLRRLDASGRMNRRRTSKALEDLSELPMTRYPHWPLAPRIWELRANITSYDAAYVALAEALGCAFVTSDRRIGRVHGVRCRVENL